MKFVRRQFLHLAAGAAALPAVSRNAWAQAYPTKPVRVLVGFAAGGMTDITARLMAQWLTTRLGQQFVVENRPGAGGNIAAETVVKGPADGYTLLIDNSAPFNAALYDKLSFNFIRDTAPIAGIVRATYVMVVHPSFPAKTVPEFIAYAKANPGKIDMASGGMGSPNHVFGELFKMMAGISMVHVPYRGGAPALTDLIGGRVQVMFIPTFGTIQYISSAALRALAVTSSTRSDAMPDLPSVGDFLPGYDAAAWNGAVAPRGTPVEIVDKLNKEINTGLADPAVKAHIVELGGVPMPMTPPTSAN
jgi:tripartite-type tricarboxylate transporter receptor subunit TctC